jgi:WD40 repeat protein/tRNA A-37 threonylcarbamoyl transferase component Bud32
MIECGLLTRTVEEEASENRVPPKSFGDYEIIEEIAHGGMGLVYKARQRSLNRIVAVKMVLAGRLATQHDLQRFRAEAETAAGLRHPNIVAIHEIGAYEGQPFFSMDFVEGKNLAQLAHYEPISVKRATKYLKTISEAVHYAHAKGVLHRDLKPSNILIDQNDQPQITDFGLAKRLGGTMDLGPPATETTDLTITGQVLGSPNFMPPEQACGDRTKIGPTSDVYSLGAILYQLLTGRPPFLAETVTQTLRLVMDADPVPPRLLSPGAPRDLETICLKCLEKDVAHRYATAQDLADELTRFDADKPIEARPTSRVEKLWRWSRRHPATATLSGIVFVLLATLLVGSIVYASRLKAANRLGLQQLRQAYVGQARSDRMSGRSGSRFRSLELLRKAALIEPLMEVRNEAIACLALEDIEPVQHIKFTNDHEPHFDQAYERSVEPGPVGTMIVRRVTDGRELERFTIPGKPTIWSFGPDRRHLLVSYEEGTTQRFQIRDLDSHKSILVRSNAVIRDFQFTEDRTQLLVAFNEPPRIVIYSLADGTEREFCRPLNRVTGVRANARGNRVAISIEDGEVEVRDGTNGQWLFPLPQQRPVTSLDWHPDGRLLGVASSDGDINVWNIDTKKSIKPLQGHEGKVTAIQFSHDGTRLMSCSQDNLFRLWNWMNGRPVVSRPIFGRFGPVSSDDRKIVLATTRDMELCLRAGAAEWQGIYFEGSIDGSNGVDGEWTAGGRLFLSRHKDGIRLWDVLRSRQLPFVLKGIGSVFDVVPDSSGSSLVCATSTGIWVWRTRWEQGRENDKWMLDGPKSIRPDVIAANMELDHAGRNLAAGVGDKVQILAWPSGRNLRDFELPGGIYGWSLSRSGRFLVAWPSSSSAQRRVWDVSTGAIVKDWPSESFYAAMFTPDDGLLITGAVEECVGWDARTWTPVWRIARENPGGTRASIAVTSDMALGALTITPQKIRLFEPATGNELATLEPPEPRTINWLEFSPDGTRLAAVTFTRVLHVWDIGMIRRDLATMNLDWDGPQPSPAQITAARPVEVDFGSKTNVPVQGPLAMNFPERDSACTSNQIDLTGSYNALLIAPWVNSAWVQNDLASLPQGLQSLDGIQFDIRGLIQLACTNSLMVYPYPKEVGNIPIKARSKTLHFLHATGWPVEDGGIIGEYILHYQDGTEASAPLKYAENISNWWIQHGLTPTIASGTSLAWRGRNPESEREGYDLVLHHFRLENPQPEKIITSLTFRSAMTQSAPFLIAITAE